MNTYIIQQRLHILAKLLRVIDGKINTSFEIDGIKFSHWYFTLAEGARTDRWLVEYEVQANNFRGAFDIYVSKAAHIISKIAFLSQVYCESRDQPFMIHKKGSDIVFFKYTKDISGVPLHFDEKSLTALKLLNSQTQISDEFYYYWNDMLNATGYSPKLLLLCSALEALAKSLSSGQNKHDFFRELLGDDLQGKIWAKNKGIRHRLIHGEYFDIEADSQDYVQQAYEKVLCYFNSIIFADELFNTNIKCPQRHPVGNKMGGFYFLKSSKGKDCFNLKDLISESEEGLDNLSGKYEFINENEIDPAY